MANHRPGWLGGPLWIGVRRGSRESRHGGAHSGPHTKRHLRFLPGLVRALAEAYAVMYKSGEERRVLPVGPQIMKLRHTGWRRVN